MEIHTIIMFLTDYACRLTLSLLKLQFYKKYIIVTSKKMKTPKFILNRTEDYLYHSKLWIIGYASLFYLCSIIIFSMLLTFCVFIYNCIGLDPETMTNFWGDPTYLKKSNDNLHFLLSVLVSAPICEELIFRLGLSSKRKIFFL